MEQEAHEGLSSFGLLERSYSVNKWEASPSSRQKTPTLPQSAAMFYIGHSPLFEVVETCKSTVKLNAFLKARRDEVSSGVPGRFLHAVMREDQISDVGSVVSSIIYAFYLNETTDDDYACVVPIINMKRTDLNTRIELKWLLDSCQIDQNSLIFLDEIDLSYYDLFGSLQVISVNGNHVLHDNHNPAKQELAGILLDTANLTSPRCTSADKYMATLLINGAGRFACSGLYQLLRIKKYDVSGLKVVDILRKDFKKWLKVENYDAGKPDGAVSRTNSSHIGMSSIGISIGQLHSHQESSIQDIKHFQQSERLRLLMVVSGYYDSQKNFKREVLVSAESTQLMKILLNYLNSCASKLPLKVMHQPVLGDEMRVFEIDNLTSRKTIEVLLEEFGRKSKH
ncbi:hypothetical protein QQ045_018611 [Rhodiola kirilowii]